MEKNEMQQNDTESSQTLGASQTNDLTPEQTEHFLEHGYVILHNCFSPELAQEWTEQALNRIGYSRSDSSTWKESRVTTFGMTHQELAEFSPKAWAATSGLLGGSARVERPYVWGDDFIFNFRDGADRPWEAPPQAKTNWHVDGDWFRHFLDSPEQGLLTFTVWSEIGPQAGGTFIAPDSIAHVARYLAERPEGAELHEIPFGELIAECREFVEVTGRVGDVILCHPFMLHANSQNHSGKPRIINNPTVRLIAPLDFNRPDAADFSLLERSILAALGVERLDWHISGPREHYTRDEIQAHRQVSAAKGINTLQTVSAA